MRTFLSKGMVLAVLTALFLTVTAGAADAIGTGVVNGEALRLRSEPSTESATLTLLSKGTTVQVYEVLDGWYKISWNERTGFVSADYLLYTPAAPAAEASQPAAPAPEAPLEAGDRVGVITAESVNFRSGPSVDAGVLSSLTESEEVTVLQVVDGWCQARWNGQDGYVSAEYVSVDGIPLLDPKGMVTGNCVNLRSGPSTNDSILTMVNSGTMVDLVSLSDGWYAVEYNGLSGYISADYVRVYAGTGGEGSSIGEDVVELALSYVGTAYVYGGSSPRGFDCSGFTMYIFGQFGYSLPHSATSQWYNSGSYVDKSDLQPGDLVLFCDPRYSKGKACSHVGIYIGDNQFVHASSSSSKYVKTDSLDSDYYSRYYVGAKRIG